MNPNTPRGEKNPWNCVLKTWDKIHHLCNLAHSTYVNISLFFWDLCGPYIDIYTSKILDFTVKGSLISAVHLPLEINIPLLVLLGQFPQ